MASDVVPAVVAATDEAEDVIRDRFMQVLALCFRLVAAELVTMVLRLIGHPIEVIQLGSNLRLQSSVPGNLS